MAGEWGVLQTVQEFVDKGISGAEGREQRPAFDALWKASHSLRVRCRDGMGGRSAGQVPLPPRQLPSELHAKKVDLFIHQQGIDTTMPTSKALFGVMGVFAELERSMIQERVRSGIKRVRAAGQRWGMRRIEETDPALCNRILELRRDGFGMAAIGKRVNLSSRTIRRFLHDVEAAGQVA